MLVLHLHRIICLVGLHPTSNAGVAEGVETDSNVEVVIEVVVECLLVTVEVVNSVEEVVCVVDQACLVAVAAAVVPVVFL